MTKPNAPELKAIIDFCASHSTSESAELNKVLKMLIEYRNTRTKDVAAVDLTDLNKDFGIVRNAIDGRMEATDGISALERIAVFFNQRKHLHPEAAQEKQEPIEGLDDALEEMEDFHIDVMQVLKNIIVSDNPKCTCNASICEHCMALNALAEAEKYFPSLYQAAKKHAAISKGQGAEGDFFKIEFHLNEGDIWSMPFSTYQDALDFAKADGRPYSIAKTEAPFGWVYFNPDTGTEFSIDHPVTSGQVPDATDIRPCTENERYWIDELTKVTEPTQAPLENGAALEALTVAQARLEIAKQSIGNLMQKSVMSSDKAMAESLLRDVGNCIAFCQKALTAPKNENEGDHGN